MTTRIFFLLLLLMLSGCAGTVTTGKHVPIIGAPERAVALATRVLTALPEDQIRSRVGQRFPQLSEKDLRRIHVSYTTMHFYDNGIDHPPRSETHLVVTVTYDQRLYPLADQICEFVAAILRNELARQKRKL